MMQRRLTPQALKRVRFTSSMLKRVRFTLIELLVVITIITVLSAIVLPFMARARAKAKSTACINNLKNIGVGIMMYLEESRDIMPVAAQLPSANFNSKPRIVDILGPHIGDTKVFRCLSDDSYYESEGASYEYNTRLGGRRVADSFLSKKWGEENVPVMYDYEPFHGKPGKAGAANYLFADGHVGDLK